MPSGNDGLLGDAGWEMDRGDLAPGNLDVAVLIVMGEGRGGGGKTTEYGLAVKYCNVHGLAVVPTIQSIDRLLQPQRGGTARNMLRGPSHLYDDAAAYDDCHSKNLRSPVQEKGESRCRLSISGKSLHHEFRYLQQSTHTLCTGRSGCGPLSEMLRWS